MIDRDFKVVSKGLKGSKKDTPFVLLVTEYGEKLTLHLADRKALQNWHIEEIFTIKIVKEQNTLKEMQ